MSDLISRRAAIDALGKTLDELYENIKKGATFPQRQWFDGMAQAQSILENLPSAQPERKKGKWTNENGADGWNRCSVCGELAIDLFDYCPNCGADMREGVEDVNQRKEDENCD